MAKTLKRAASASLERPEVAPVRRLVLRRRWTAGGKPPHLPKCPEGWTASPPTWVGVGSQKAGTSWWHSLIAAHPDMQNLPGLPKELHFFERFWNREFTSDDELAYSRYFARPPGRAAGEWTPRYMFDSWTPALIRRAAPNAKILVLLRDPIDRYCSGVRHDLESGGVPGPMLAAMAFLRGLYYDQLLNLRDSFPREQILALQYEKCCLDPAAELRKTYEFLQFDDVNFVPDELRRPVNTSRSRPVAVPVHMRERLTQLYSSDTSRLMETFPDLDPKLWPSLLDSRL